MTPLPAAAALVAALAGISLLGDHGGGVTPASDAGLFGAPLRNVHAKPLYVERATGGRMRNVRCAGAGPGVTLQCYEPAG